jgi:cytochrome bd-type quinol oxidase subunit 2
MNNYVVDVLILLVLVLFAKLLYVKYCKLHTKERFAFFIVAAAMTLALPFVYQAFSPEGVIYVVIKTYWLYVEAKISFGKIDWGCLVVAVLVVVLVLGFMVYVFRNWGGRKDEDKKDEKE